MDCMGYFACNLRTVGFCYAQGSSHDGQQNGAQGILLRDNRNYPGFPSLSEELRILQDVAGDQDNPLGVGEGEGQPPERLFVQDHHTMLREVGAFDGLDVPGAATGQGVPNRGGVLAVSNRKLNRLHHARLHASAFHPLLLLLDVAVQGLFLVVILAGVGQVLVPGGLIGDHLLMAVSALLLSSLRVFLCAIRGRGANQETAQQDDSGQTNFPMGHDASARKGSNCITTHVSSNTAAGLKENPSWEWGHSPRNSGMMGQFPQTA